MEQNSSRLSVPHLKLKSMTQTIDTQRRRVMSESEGAARRARAQGMRAPQHQERLRSLDPQLAEWTDDFVFGQVWGRSGLDEDERMLIAITALGTIGELNLMKNYLHGALQAGIPPAKIHEALVMLVIYAGFPRCVSALYEWRQVLDSAVRQGVVTAEQAEPPIASA
jgi:4-carboxymuconolactone decarboxylase